MEADERERLVRIEEGQKHLIEQIREHVVERLDNHGRRLARIEKVVGAAATIGTVCGAGLAYFREVVIEWAKKKVGSHS